jgi:hypothetical protein
MPMSFPLQLMFMPLLAGPLMGGWWLIGVRKTMDAWGACGH